MSIERLEIDVIRELFKDPKLNPILFIHGMENRAVQWLYDLDMWGVYESGGEIKNPKLLFTFQIWTIEVLNKIIGGK